MAKNGRLALLTALLDACFLALLGFGGGGTSSNYDTSDPTSLGDLADQRGLKLGAAVYSVLTWGFTDRHSWIPGFITGYGYAMPFDSSYGKKTAYYGIQSALKGQ